MEQNRAAPLERGGMGKPGTPAIVNAVFAATGARLRELRIGANQLRSG